MGFPSQPLHHSCVAHRNYDIKTATLEEINMKLHVGAMLRQAWHGEPFSLEAFINGEDEVLHEGAFWNLYWVAVKKIRR
jgi:hypothetical protein